MFSNTGLRRSRRPVRSPPFARRRGRIWCGDTAAVAVQVAPGCVGHAAVFLTTAWCDQCYKQEGRNSDQEVRNHACGEAQDATLRRSWRRPGMNFLHESDGIATTTSVELEERVGLRRAVAAQFSEDQAWCRPVFPEQPVSLAPSARASTHIACQPVGTSVPGAVLPSGANRTNRFLRRESRRSGSPRPFCPWSQIQRHLALTDRSCRS